MNEPTFENNIQGEDIAGPSDQVNFPSKPNYGRPSKSALPMEIRFDNIGHMAVEEKYKARRRQCKNNNMYMCAKCQVHLQANGFEQFHTK